MALSGPYRAALWGPQRVALESQAGSLAGSSVGSAFRSADSQALGWIWLGFQLDFGLDGLDLA